MVNPIGSPADDLVASAVLVMTTCGQSTVIVAVLEWPSTVAAAFGFAGASLEADTVAVLDSVPQSSMVVSPVTTTVTAVPAAMASKVQVRVLAIDAAVGRVVDRPADPGGSCR